MDNILLTLVAPDFVFIELMFFCGYKKDIYKDAQKQIESNIAEYRASFKKSEWLDLYNK